MELHERIALHEKIAAMRDYIMEHGHCKWQLEDSQGRVCLTGAGQRTPRQNFRHEYVNSFLAKLAIELGLVEVKDEIIEVPNIVPDIVAMYPYHESQADLAFNNHPDTTINDVIEFLRTAEVRAKELL